MDTADAGRAVSWVRPFDRLRVNGLGVDGFVDGGFGGNGELVWIRRTLGERCLG